MIKHLFALAPFLIAVLLTPTAFANTTLLSYWSFNNGAVGTEKGLGVWNAEPAPFGEAFNSDEKRLSSNKDGGTIFHGDNIYVDFSSLSGVMGKNWGVFVDTKINKPKEDSTQGGSLAVSSINQSNNITFALSSEGYHNLEISFASRESQAAVIQWSWSTDNSTFTPFDEESGNGVFHPMTINLSGPGGKGLTQLDNQKALYLRATFLYPGGRGMVAMDNFQFTGSPVGH